jgi:hypothetical protein
LRLRRKKPGYSLQFLSPPQGPAAGLRDFRFYPLHGRKSASMRIFTCRFCAPRKQGLVTADILSA